MSADAKGLLLRWWRAFGACALGCSRPTAALEELRAAHLVSQDERRRYHLTSYGRALARDLDLVPD